MNTFEIALRSNQMPSKIEELVPMSFIGNEAISFFRSKLRLMKTLPTTSEQRDKILDDGQKAGIMLIEIERRIGELAKKLMKSKIRVFPYMNPALSEIATGKKKRIEIAKQFGFKNKCDLDRCMIIAGHKKETRLIITRAKSKGEIPVSKDIPKEIKNRYNLKCEKKRKENHLCVRFPIELYQRLKNMGNHGDNVNKYIVDCVYEKMYGHGR